MSEELAEAWAAAWRGEGTFEDCCTADISYEDPVAVNPLAGAHALSEHAGRLRAAFPDLRVERTAPVLADADARHACIAWRAVGTHKEDLGALPATNRFVVLQGVHLVELDDGRVRRARGFFDLYEAGIQLGLLPQRGSAAESALLLLRGFGLRPRAT
ncbi:MAG TPA: ester cyclase [Thermoleophilaceae bacterium]